MYWNDRHCVCCGNVCPDHQKDQEYMQQEASLQKQLEEETARGEQLSSYETYTKSQQYVEDTAKSKLGLAYDNEIIFKEAK